MTQPLPPALAAAIEIDAIPPVHPMPTGASWLVLGVVRHLKSWVRAEIELRLHGVGLADRRRHNP